MYLLVGSVFLFACMAFASSESCGQIMDCINHGQNVKSAAESGNIDAMCKMQKSMVDCFSSALADCQNSGSSFPQETLSQFQSTMSEARKQYDKTCAGRGGSGSGAGTGGNGGGYSGGSEGSIPQSATCMEAAKCAFDIMKVQNALNENRLEEVCAIVTPSAKCMKSAFNDCQKNKVLPEEQLKGMSDQVKQVDSILGEHCGGGASGIGVSAVYMTLISALALIVLRLF